MCHHPFKTGQQKGSAGILSALLQTHQEGMGLLEYQAKLYLRDVAHDGWLCTFTM
jgi:hypothetical protein